MKKEIIYSKILGCGVTTYYNWKREDDRPMLKLLEKYFTDSDLIEFLDTNEIVKFRLIEDFKVAQKKYILEIKKVIQELWLKTIHECGGSLEDVDSSCAVPYTRLFTDYLLIYQDINNKTYNEYILKKAAEYGAKNHEITISLDKYERNQKNEAPQEDIDSLESYQNDLLNQFNNNKLEFTAITGISQIMSNLNKEHILQLQILIKSDFDLIMSSYTSKQELNDFWIDFWIGWVCQKYNYRSSKKIRNIIKGQDVKKIDFKNIIEKIKNNEL